MVAVPGAQGNSHLILVTAKHFADRMERCPMLVGFDYKDGAKAILEADNIHWYAHPIEANAVDAAVTPFAPEQWDLLDVEPFPEHPFASGERTDRASVAVGDEITAIGVFTRFSWEDRHLPIVRTGNLAMLPSLRIPAKNLGPWKPTSPKLKG